MKKAAILFILVFLFCAPLFAPVATPTKTAVAAEAKEVMQDNVPLNIFQEASAIQRVVRVALYDEPSAAPPSYSSIGLWTTNITVIEILLVDAGFEVTRLTEADIDGTGVLRTGLFDVFVMVDNNPRDTITDDVLNFWKGGGGILSFDGAINFLCYFGVLIPDSEGNNGYGTFWDYVWTTNHTVTNRHPVSQNYAVGDKIADTNLDWATVDITTLLGFSYLNEYTTITHSEAGTTSPTTLARDTVLGGRVVQTFGDGNPIADGHDAMIIDAIDWLCPRPKARVVFDYSHRPYYGIDANDPYLGYSSQDRYADWRDALVNRTYTVDKLYPSLEGNLTAENLAPYDVLVIAAPLWNFTAAEVTAVTNWVAEGGGLFLMGDYTGFPDEIANINYLLSEFDMSLSTNDYIVYSFPTSELEMHPTVEYVSSTHYQGGVYVNVTGAAYPLWYDGPNIINAAQEYGMGRIFLVGDINFPGNFFDYEDNVQYSINLVNWLSSGPATVLLYVDEPFSANYHRTPVAYALNELGVDYFITTTEPFLNLSMHVDEWYLVIVDNPWWNLGAYHLEFIDYIESGGRFLMSGYQVSLVQSSPLWPMLGFEYAANMLVEVPIYTWDDAAPIFNTPHDYGAANFTATHDYGDQGDLLTVFGNATALAGYTDTPQDGNATIVMRNDGKTIYNAYLIDSFQDDYDDSTYTDNYELWLNEIAYMLRPTIDEPADVEYVEGTTGHSIVWHPDSIYPAEYLIEREAILVEHEPWDGDTIGFGIDGLASGTYVIIITVFDRAGYAAVDEVIVTVTEAPTTPPTTTTTTGSPTAPPIDPTLLIVIVGAAGVILVVVVLILKWRGRE